MKRCLKCMEVYEDEYDVCPYCGYIEGTPPKVISHLMPGTVINDRYIIGTVIKNGGFGIIYVAWDNDLGIKVAIKEYYPNGLVNRVPGTTDVIVLGDEKQDQYRTGLARFLQEARTMAKFSKIPNIVYVYDFLEANNTAYIVMEHLEGVDLKDHLSAFEDERMPLEDAVHIVTEIGRALSAIHKGKIVHRDISPDNIYLCSDGRVKLLDLGAARLSSGEKTETLSVILKPGYAPPEQYRNKSKQGPKTDVYALAATMYRMITGVLPVESLDRMVEDTLKKPSGIVEDLPPWVDTVIMTGMARNPEVRFPTADKFIEAINKEKVVKTPEHRIRMRRLTRAAALVVIAVIVGFISYDYFGMYSDISGEGVPKGEISVWIAVDNDSDENRYEEFETSFEKKFKGKELDIKYIPEEEYAEKLEAAAGSDGLPDVFMGNYLDDPEKKVNINGIINDVPLRHFYLLKDNITDIKNNRAIPMGYMTYVLYENTYLSGKEGMSFVEEGGADTAKEDSDSILFDPKKTSSSVKFFEEIPYSSDAREKFLKEKRIYYVGTVSEKGTIQKKLKGYSEVTELTKDGRSYGVLSNSLSISADADRKSRKIARLMIKYGLSEEGQDVLCIRNQGLLPLNKGAFGNFTDINESLDFIKPGRTEIITIKD